MNIGLIRHFKVNCSHQTFMTSDDFIDWNKQYDCSEIIENLVNLADVRWSKCFASDLPRAVKTAKAVFTGEIIENSLLKEVPMSPIFDCSLKLPYAFWCISSRTAWLLNHPSQIETRTLTTNRAKTFLDSIKYEPDQDILIVCHGFFMYTLQKELKLLGFKGQNIHMPQNGRLYLYSK